ncbi:hypothetical protein LX36DRAFT_654653 [Colletotrichum falcatum]|nr:hypothetical protein LX36DRAFT_654653 [Colletotrichum falcatum]
MALAATIQAANACALYAHCRCTMAGGVIDNNMTTTACAEYRRATGVGYYLTDTAYLPTVDDHNTTWCSMGSFDANKQAVLSNCDFRSFCTWAGATGEDSWCMDKRG